MGKKAGEGARASQKKPATAIDSDEEPGSLVLISTKPQPQDARGGGSRANPVVKDRSAAGSIGGSLRGSAIKTRRGRGGLGEDSSIGSSFASSADASTAGSARKGNRKATTVGVDTKVLGKRLSLVAEERAGGAGDLSTTEDESESPQKPTQKPKRGKGTATESIRTLGYAPGSSDEEPEDESEGEAGAPSHKIPGATRQVYHYVRAMPWVCSSALHAMHCIVMFA